MKIKITFRSMKHSDAIENYAKEKLAKLDKFFKRDNSSTVSYNLTLEAHRSHNFFISELHVTSSHYNLNIKGEDSDMYQAIDNIINKMEHELAKEKRKFVDNLKHGKKAGQID